MDCKLYPLCILTYNRISFGTVCQGLGMCNTHSNLQMSYIGWQLTGSCQHHYQTYIYCFLLISESPQLLHFYIYMYIFYLMWKCKNNRKCKNRNSRQNHVWLFHSWLRSLRTIKLEFSAILCIQDRYFLFIIALLGYGIFLENAWIHKDVDLLYIV